MSNLNKLLYLKGISAEYHSYSGEQVTVPWEDRLELLRVTGCDPTNQQKIQQAVFELDAKPWQSWLQPANVVILGKEEYLDFRVHSDELDHVLSWQILLESGTELSGRVRADEQTEIGEYYIEAARYSAHRMQLPDLPLGYHQISFIKGRRCEKANLVVAPQHCYQIDHSKKIWGISCQLYTLRSERNWGMGDFTDLLELVELAAEVGAELIGLNPLHAPQMTGADFASPYSPSDRRFLNPLYIDPEKVTDFSECTSICEHVATSFCQEQLSELRELDLVDYDGVAALKYPVFEAMFRYFKDNHLASKSARATDFHNFVKAQGQPLVTFAEFESTHSGLWFRSAKEPEFHLYLQWIAGEQLQQCQILAQARDMHIGLVGDLAVGAVKGGAETAGNIDLFGANASIGAPPDPFAPQGQDWNLPVIDPIAFRKNGYQHFIELLRANMAFYGALRIDHIMGLMRLWWCLPNNAGGAYVYYPMDDLFAILCLESQRNQCLIIGEDMGVVPDELRQKMAESGVYSNKLFYFERSHGQKFRSPNDHQQNALLMVSNHDVPTLAGWWQANDLEIRAEIGLIDRITELPLLLDERNQDKTRLLDWLNEQDVLPAEWINQTEKNFDLSLCQAILLANARSRSRILSIQLEDLQLICEPVNIPGTYREYPNWRRKQAFNTRNIFQQADIPVLMSRINQERTL